MILEKILYRKKRRSSEKPFCLFFLLSVFLFPFPAFCSELFDGWEKPKLVFIFTGFLNGYVEPCGCAGLENMKGGLSRRLTFFQELEKRGWDILPIDAGNLNKGFGRQEELKYNFVIDESLRKMKYAVAGIGNRELKFPTETLILYSVDSPSVPKRYTSANAGILEFSPDFVPPFRTFEKNGIKVGVISVLGKSLLDAVENNDIKKAEAVAKIKEVLPELEKEKCQYKILIVFGTAKEIDDILKPFPGTFDFVLPSSTSAEPPLEPKYLGKTMLVETGEKGRFAVAVGLFDDEKTPVKYERVPMDVRFKSSETVITLMKLYQEQLEKTGFSGLGLHPVPDSRLPLLGKFTGSASCADCHDKATAVWKKSKHHQAWDTLKTAAIPPRQHDPECVACHVTGWDAKELLPLENGFWSEKKTPQLVSVGCESCHGPGEKHIQAEKGNDKTLQEKLRIAVHLSMKEELTQKHCILCHDGDNSPDFDFNTYWKKIEHNNE